MRHLFFKECKAIAKSLTYWLFILISIVDLYSQMPNTMTQRLTEPRPGQTDYSEYGHAKFVEDPEKIIPEATKSLMDGFVSNHFSTYPIGFYKSVKLNEAKREKLAQILSELTTYSKAELLGLTKEEWFYEPDAADGDVSTLIARQQEAEQKKEEELRRKIAPGISYKRFQEGMAQADELLGGGSEFDPQGETFRRSFGQVPLTYEDALERYQDIVEKDRVSNAYARLFCDYFGIILGILPVFVAVAAGMRDRRARMNPLAYTRRVSSLKLMAVRYGALVFLLFLPVLVLSIGAAVQLGITYRGSGLSLDSFAFLKNALLWLLPTLLVSTSVGFFLTQLTESPIAIAVQGIWWFLDVFGGTSAGIGGGEYGWSLIPRHNALGGTALYLDNLSQLVKNRLAYAALALALAGAAAIVYEYKRRGKLNVWSGLGAVLSNHKVKS